MAMMVRTADQPPALTGGHHRTSPEERAAIRHPYVEGVHTKQGKDGRVYRLCRVCDLAANAGRHRSEAQVAQAAATRAAHRGQPRPEPQPKGPHGGNNTPLIVGHPYVAGLASTADKRGHRLVLCATCDKPANSPKHRAAAQPGARPFVLASRTDREASPALAPVLGTPTTGRTRTLATPTMAGEYVQLALAIDQVLALPADAVGWKLRLRLADARSLLDVPQYPSLAAEDYEPVPDAPPQAVLDARPELMYKPAPVRSTSVRGILRGIRSDRIKRLATRAQEQGWDVSLTGSGHLRLAKGDQVVVASTTAETGSGHGWGNTRAAAKRAGIDVTGL